MSNTITAFFKGRIGVAEAVYQNDYGIIMIFDSIELPSHFTCYFSVIGEDEAIPGIGADRQVVIPNACLAKAGNVTLHIPLHTGANDSEVEYVVYFKVIGRARPADDGTPVQMAAIERALALLQAPLTNIEDIVNDALAFTGPTLAQLESRATALESDTANLKPRMGKAESDIDVLEARVDSFTHLTEGSTTGDAELIDGRVGADGVTYGNIGTANRTQFTNITAQTKNLANSDKVIIGRAWNGSANTARAIINVEIPPSTTYSISFDSTGFDAVTAFEKINESDTTNVWSSGITSPFTRKSGATTHCLCLQFNKTDVSKADFANLNLQVETNSVATPYMKPISANDIHLRNEVVTFVTPEMFGAWGDGVHDDTLAIQAALDTGKNVVANKKYKTTDSLTMSPIYQTGQKFEFNSIICSVNKAGLICKGRNGYINGFYLESAGTALVFTSTSGDATYNWDVHISVITSTGNAGITLGGEYAISEIDISAERINYYSNGINFDLANYWVGQVSFRNMTITTENDNAGYAFFANCNTHPLTGLTVYNVSLEGSRGGFNFVNQAPNRNVETLNCFGLRTSEMSIRDHFNVLRYVGSGTMRGAICLDGAMLSSFDLSGASAFNECLVVIGRLMGTSTDDIYGMAVGQPREIRPIRLANLISE